MKERSIPQAPGSREKRASSEQRCRLEPFSAAAGEKCIPEQAGENPCPAGAVTVLLRTKRSGTATKIAFADGAFRLRGLFIYSLEINWSLAHMK